MKELHTGISGSTIRVAHREYAASVRAERGGVRPSSHAREAFYLDLEYDLSETTEISFRDIKIQVSGASPEEIVFSVTEDGRD